ncbi:hypothetical protein [Ottowia sp. VDI28]|uniref:hypothetical protein n=1 Tax=Ottowia sp. VDI28 TaxID=3133968 RepID=UPI003C2B2DE1
MRRQEADSDRRRKQLWLTPAGEQAAVIMKTDVVRVQERILAPLDVAERQQLMGLLAKLVSNHDGEAAS